MRINELFISRINWKRFAPAFIILLNTFVWYSLGYPMLSNTLDNLSVSGAEKLVLFAMYFIGVASSAILGASFLRRKRETSLLFWMLAGVLMTLLAITIPYNTALTNSLITFFLGASLGIGLPSCLAYFADVVSIEIRGSCAGITWCIVGVFTLILALLVSSLDFSLSFMALAIWRGLGVLFFFLGAKMAGKVQEAQNPVAYRSILRKRDVMLYLIPWITFSLVNFTETPMFETLFGSSYFLVNFVEFALIGCSALVGGILADVVGRKRVIITGFVMLGIGYAVLSFSSGILFSRYLYVLCDGIAGGMFFPLFLAALWGDLAQNSRKEKYYVVGGLPFLLASFLEVIIKPYVEFMGLASAFSLASFFLFIAVLPLIYAPETLPEKRIREIELKAYLEDAIKAKEKYT